MAQIRIVPMPFPLYTSPGRYKGGFFMTTAAIKSGSFVQDPVLLKTEGTERIPSLWTKIRRIWELIVEVGFKEMRSVFTSAFNFFVSLVNPNPYGLNPETALMSKTDAKIAKAVILLPGAGGRPFCFFPMAKTFEERGIKNVFTVVKFDQTEQDPVPLKPIAEKIDQVSKICFQSGAKFVDIALIGHSLGAIAAAKWIWRHAKSEPNVNVSMMVSVAGRLRYLPNKFSWFAEDVKDEIELTYQVIAKQPGKALFYSVSGETDGIVPSESVHIMQDKESQFVAEGEGHGGVVSAASAIKKISDWTYDWANA